MPDCDDIQVDVYEIQDGNSDCDFLKWDVAADAYVPAVVTASCVSLTPIEVCGQTIDNLQDLLEFLSCIAVCPTPGLTIFKSASTSGPVEVGEEFTETVTVTNTNTTLDATNVYVDFTSFGPNLEIVGANPFPEIISSVPAGTSVDIVFVVRATEGARGGAVSNTVAITEVNGVPQTGPSSTVTIPVYQGPVINSIDKSVDDTGPHPEGAQVIYSISIPNTGDQDAQVEVELTPDTGITNASQSFPQTVTVPAGGEWTTQFTANVDSSGGTSVNCKAEIISIDGTAPSSEISDVVTVFIEEILDATIDKRIRDTGGGVISEIGSGDQFDYIHVVTNTGNTAAVMTVADPLPPEVSYVSGATYPYVTSSIPVGATEEITTRVQVVATTGTIENTATITAINGSGVSIQDSESIDIIDEFSATIDKQFQDGGEEVVNPIESGSEIQIAIEVTNTSTTPATVTVADIFPSGISYVSGTTYPATSPSLAIGASHTFVTTVLVTGTVDEVIQNTASVTDVGGSPVTGINDSASVTIADTDCDPAFTISKTLTHIDVGGTGTFGAYSGQAINVCDVLRFTYVVTNTSVSCDYIQAGGNAFLTDTLPLELGFDNSPNPGSVIHSGAGYSFDIPDLAAGAIAVFTLEALAATDGTGVTNLAEVGLGSTVHDSDTVSIDILTQEVDCLEDPTGILGEFGTPELVQDLSSVNGDLGGNDNLTDITFDPAPEPGFPNGRIIMVDDSGKVYVRDPDPAAADTIAVTYQDPAWTGSHITPTSDYEGAAIYNGRLYVVSEWGKDLKIFDSSNIGAGLLANVSLGPVIGISGCGSFPADCTDETVVCGPTPWVPGGGNGEIPGVQNAGPNSVSIEEIGANTWLYFTTIWDGSVHRVQLDGTGLGIVAGTGERHITPFNADAAGVTDEGPVGNVTPNGAGPWSGTGNDYSTYWCFERNSACNLGGFGLNRRSTVTGSFNNNGVIFVINSCENVMYAIDPDTPQVISARWQMPATLSQVTGLAFAEVSGTRYLYITEADGSVIRFLWPTCIDQGTGALTSCGQNPNASATATPSLLDGSFDATASTDPDGTIVKYIWSFGDGTFGGGSTIVHSYGSSGTYTWALAVEDDDGLRDIDSGQITVNATACALPVGSASTPRIFHFDDFSNEPDGPINIGYLISQLGNFRLQGIGVSGYDASTPNPNSPAACEADPAGNGVDIVLLQACQAGIRDQLSPLVYKGTNDQFTSIGQTPDASDVFTNAATNALYAAINASTPADPLHVTSGGKVTEVTAAIQRVIDDGNGSFLTDGRVYFWSLLWNRTAGSWNNGFNRLQDPDAADTLVGLAGSGSVNFVLNPWSTSNPASATDADNTCDPASRITVSDARTAGNNADAQRLWDFFVERVVCGYGGTCAAGDQSYWYDGGGAGCGGFAESGAHHFGDTPLFTQIINLGDPVNPYTGGFGGFSKNFTSMIGPLGASISVLFHDISVTGPHVRSSISNYTQPSGCAPGPECTGANEPQC